MNIEFLKEFIILSDSLSYSAAAAQLSTSQSTLSRHMQLLEKAVGKQLFTRTTRRMILSDFGKYFLPYAKKAVSSHEALKVAITKWDESTEDAIVLGCTPYSHLYTMTENVIAFRKKYPNISVKTVEQPLEVLSAEFRKGSFRLATMAYPTQMKPPANMVINGRGRLVAIMSAKDPLASKQYLTTADIKDCDLYLPPHNNAFNRMFRQICKKDEIEPNIVSESRFETNLRRMKAESGIVIETRALALQHPDPDLVIINLEPDFGFYHGLLYADHLTRNEETFVNFVKAKYPQN